MLRRVDEGTEKNEVSLYFTRMKLESQNHDEYSYSLFQKKGTPTHHTHIHTYVRYVRVRTDIGYCGCLCVCAFSSLVAFMTSTIP